MQLVPPRENCEAEHVTQETTPPAEDQVPSMALRCNVTGGPMKPKAQVYTKVAAVPLTDAGSGVMTLLLKAGSGGRASAATSAAERLRPKTRASLTRPEKDSAPGGPPGPGTPPTPRAVGAPCAVAGAAAESCAACVPSM
jgi:hypothetical protein